MISVKNYKKLYEEAKIEKANKGKLYRAYVNLGLKHRILGCTGQLLDWETFYILSVMAQKGHMCCEHLAPGSAPVYILTDDEIVNGRRQSDGLIDGEFPILIDNAWEICEADGLSDIDDRLTEISAKDLLKKLSFRKNNQ